MENDLKHNHEFDMSRHGNCDACRKETGTDVIESHEEWAKKRGLRNEPNRQASANEPTNKSK